MKHHSFFLRLFLGNLLIVAGVMAVAGAVSYRSLNDYHVRCTYAYQDSLARAAQQHLESVWPQAGPEIDRFCKRFEGGPAEEAPPAPGLEQGLPVRLTVIDSDGRVLGDSRSDPARMTNHRTADRPEVLAALDGRPLHDVRHSETLGTEYRYVALPVRRDGRVVAAVRVAMPVGRILESEAVIRDVLLGAALVAVAGFALLGLLVNWIWYAPLKRIARAARQISSGDLAHRAQILGHGELGELGQALNAMRDSLAGQIATITAQREGLRQVVANLREGVLALDATGRIALANRAAVDLLAPGEADLTGRSLQGAVRVTAILDAYNEAVTSGRPVRRQVAVDLRSGRRHLDVHVAAAAGAAEGAPSGLIVVHDVTDLVLAGAVKAEFVANASHELRTPLATLRAAVDALAAADAGDRASAARLVEMLDRHVRRLEDLTRDLLDLHWVEAGRDLAPEPVALAALAGWVRAQFAQAAAEKGVALEFDVPSADATVTANRRLLELVLQNLVDNAVKFTPAGGHVTCAMQMDAGRLRLRVSDTGVGIRREDRPRIFERFFQADASRTGGPKTRGTGLGLAIVKHACDRLGAKVDLESDVGNGTTVTVVVPGRAGP